MFKKLFLTFFSLFVFFIIIFPSKKENTNLFDYCYAFVKILTRNSLEKTDGNLKLAVLLISGAETVSIAKKLINKEGQNLRSALKQLR